MTDASANPPAVEPLPRHAEADAWAQRLDATAPPGPDDISGQNGDWPVVGSVPVTVLVSVKNEQEDLPECLRRLRWAEQVMVIDSGSTDATVPIAQAFGAEVVHFDYAKHSPTGWPKKRNWALDHAPLRNEWVLLMDGDEHVVAPLASQIAEIVTGKSQPNQPGGGQAFWINRRFIFHGRWVRYGGYYPAWNLRLFKHALGRFERLTSAGDTGSGDMEVHEHVKLAPEAGEAGFLDHDLLHYEIADFTEWVAKHNRYSSWEAAVARSGVDDGIPATFWGSPQQRRRWMKKAAKSLPFRPTLRFWYHFGLRQGFREGNLGLQLARLLAAYESMTLAKQSEPAPRNASDSA
ncbi:glycosyltransferase family 2 protein [Algisphaera agarilytica]|uniref:Glycosyltransferase involved in cell wall biosynthesis n=1 Tax=Algisphaera agarilytica TaxID=1385975 RepID=A0A7X0H7P3_9BACT|nr:glycosyltransferase family 2 protein [Algisphaera agarilytica]MBB6430793.1 glycosyltransferase involved in cell wall biosynthesis [Algisphaera agarilytica]